MFQVVYDCEETSAEEAGLYLNARLPVSHRLQRRQADCLAACAAILSAYYRVTVGYQQLLDLLQIGPAGAPFRNLRFLEARGLRVTIRQGRLHTLRQQLRRGNPPIAFVNTGHLPYWREATAHAVVVVGIEGQRVLLNDPAFPRAPQEAPLGDFDLAWLEMDEYFALVQRQASSPASPTAASASS